MSLVNKNGPTGPHLNCEITDVSDVDILTRHRRPLIFIHLIWNYENRQKNARYLRVTYIVYFFFYHLYYNNKQHYKRPIKETQNITAKPQRWATTTKRPNSVQPGPDKKKPKEDTFHFLATRNWIAWKRQHVVKGNARVKRVAIDFRRRKSSPERLPDGHRNTPETGRRRRSNRRMTSAD